MQNKIDWRQKWIGAYLGGRPSTSIRDSQYKGLNKKWEKRGKDSFDSYDYFGPTLRQGGSHGFLLLGREEREIFVELFFEESAILLDEQDSFSERISFLFDSWMMDSQHIIHFEHLLFHQSITVFSQRVYPFCNYWSCWFAIIFGSLLAFRIFFAEGYIRGNLILILYSSQNRPISGRKPRFPPPLCRPFLLWNRKKTMIIQQI